MTSGRPNTGGQPPAPAATMAAGSGDGERPALRGRPRGGVAAMLAKAAATVRGWVRGVVSFATQGVWDVEPAALRGMRKLLVLAVRVSMLVVRGFRADECVLRASSLTFMSLLAIVPVMALSLSLAKGVMDGDELRQRASASIHKLFEDYFPEAAVADDDADESGFTGAANAGAGIEGAESGSAPALAQEAALEESQSQADQKSQEPRESQAEPEELPAPEEPETGGLNEEFFQGLASKAFDVVDKLNFRALGGIGLLLLLWTVISLVGNVERAFNHVWGVRSVRPLARRFTDYLSVLVILPLLAIAAASMPVVALLERKMNEVDGALGLPVVAGIPFFKGVWVLCMLTILFCFLLRFTPNTRVKLLPGLMGGFVAAVGFSVWLKTCLGLQIGVAKYSTFFGSFAAVPILLFWLYVSWTILLVACEVSFAAQNADTYEMERGRPNASWRARLVLAAEMLAELAESIRTGGGTLRVDEFHHRRRVPVRFARDVARRLCDAGVLVPVTGEPDSWASRVDLQRYTTAELAKALLDVGDGPEALGVAALPASEPVSRWLGSLGADSPRVRDLSRF